MFKVMCYDPIENERIEIDKFWTYKEAEHCFWNKFEVDGGLYCYYIEDHEGTTYHPDVDVYTDIGAMGSENDMPTEEIDKIKKHVLNFPVECYNPAM